MKWELRIQKAAQKELSRISIKYQRKIVGVFPIIADDPFVGKNLQGRLSGSYSYPVPPYRIIYKMYKKMLVVVIIKIGHRQGIYN